MMKFYTIYYTTWHNGKKLNTKTAKALCDEANRPEEWHKAVTWENLTEMYHDYACCCCFNIWNLKRGRVVSFFNDCFGKGYERDVKEWKHKELGIALTCEVHEISPSIQFVLDWHDGEKAIQYLTERGLKIGG